MGNNRPNIDVTMLNNGSNNNGQCVIIAVIMVMGLNDAKMSNKDLLVPGCCYAVALAGLHIGTWFCFVSFIANRRVQQECHTTQVRAASTKWRYRQGVGLGHHAPSAGSGSALATGFSSSCNFTLAYLRKSVFSCPRAPGASCSTRKV